MDDSPYICSSDMLDIIYDEGYFKNNTVWEGECYLFERFKDENVNRFLIGEGLWDRALDNYNILGITLSKKENNLERLKSKGWI
jgi:hypothetical protein